jgi:hypothetical protein
VECAPTTPNPNAVSSPTSVLICISTYMNTYLCWPFAFYFERLIEYFLCLKSNLITSRSLLVVALWPNRWASFDLEDLWMLENWKGKLKYMESWIRAWNTNNGEYFSPPVTWARTLTIINAWFEKTARNGRIHLPLLSCAELCKMAMEPSYARSMLLYMH